MHICAIMNEGGEIVMLNLITKTVEGPNQDYAGHHEAEQAERDDNAGDETVPPVEVLHVRVPPPIMLPPHLIVASVYLVLNSSSN